MKQIEKVSIGGYVFTLETEAAAETERYLKGMSDLYSNPEIMEGIEERMAELLRERTTNGGVVSKSDIISIIDILGRPERIAQEEPDDAAPDKPAKRLYRDKENARLAGVCSGLGAYFKIDPVILRVAFAVLTIAGFWGFADKNGTIAFTAPIIYAILWICIPEARTARQRWALRGDNGSAENIRRSIESGAGEVRSAIRQVGNSPAWSSLGRIFEVAVGLLLIVTAVSGLVTGGIATFGWQWLGFGGLINELSAEITEDFPLFFTIMAAPWVKALALAVYGLPFIGMLYGGIMLLFRIKSPSWRPGLVIFILWLMAIIAFGILVASAFASSVII